MSEKKKGVIIGVDPHKMSVTIEVVDTHERLLGSGRFDTTNTGYAAMQRYVRVARSLSSDARDLAILTWLFSDARAGSASQRQGPRPRRARA